MKRTLIVLIFVLLNYPAFSQVDMDMIINDSVTDIEIPQLSFPIHKIAIKDTLIWASDYGNGKIFKSIDNGKTFQELTTLRSEYFESIQFLDSNTGFISGDYGYVYKTKDGGESWIEISPPIKNRIKANFRNDSTKNQKPDGVFVAYYSMHFISDSSGFVSGYSYNPKQGFRESYERVFFLTKDGGLTWRQQNNLEKHNTLESFKNKVRAPNMYFENEYFQTKDISWRTGKSKEKSEMLIKTKYDANVSDTLILPETPYKRVMLRNIIFLTNNVGFIFGGSLDKQDESSIIFRTNDGGKNWDYVESSVGHIHVAALNDQYLFLFGKRGLMKRIKKQEITRNKIN
ncbi:MAG: hypothetical protein ABJH08_03490 [Balneola sp.]